MGPALSRKLALLRARIRKMDSAIVAYSGGLDSAFLLRICREELGDRAVGITIMPHDYPLSELTMARRVAKVVGVRHLVIDPAADPDMNLMGRKEGAMCIGRAYKYLKGFSGRLNFRNVVDGYNLDDRKRRDMGLIASKEAGFRSPLLESGLSKAEIRMLAKEIGLPDWDEMRGSSKVMLMPLSKRLSSMERYVKRISGTAHELQRSGPGLTISSDARSLLRLVRDISKIQAKAHALGFGEVSLRLSS